ncbi:hypothetical protein M409DRAFT_18856 [Zasmidium cellare ATCC 36951]|uniref:Protein FAF1 n=1 Tax=Zasmidium cellare ATCC 36951 TaxID=1080233 RepID=A0A6A6CUP4_ZASCE|nr:uncharacterized protein M409DRAFT_18856 [Zasmidium cellare ATCC 36951]KAF2170884.1 hypothetical protein M409DRAFT_18856 [Zasmidium cellare ATCC 36951]
MAVTLGKRKRRAYVRSEEPRQRERSRSDSEDDETARALFQRAFEAKFRPLELSKKTESRDEDDESDDLDDDEGLESDWSGLSEDEDAVEVVELSQPNVDAEDGGDFGKKAFMSSKPPAIDEIFSKATRKPSKEATSGQTGTESANLKNDLALQRLLKESHLLDPSSFSKTASTPEGKGRLKALDMRLQDLGAKSSALEQEKMPLSHRKGITSKSANREASRRKEAVENGVILEKQKFVAKSTKKRDRGIGGPEIGKFRGGTLKLSSKDVRNIERSGGKGKGGKGGKR